jgi:hypothetical protein
MPVYRYVLETLGTDIARAVDGPLILNLSGPTIYKDISAPITSKDDLDAFMLSKGFVYTETDPPAPLPQPTPIPPGSIISFLSAVATTQSATPTRQGELWLDLANWPATLGPLNRAIRFIANIETNNVAKATNVRLQNMTDGETVTGTDLTTSSLGNTEVSADIVVGIAAGNLKTAKLYAVQLSLTAGGLSDFATITNARLVVTYG